MNVYPLSPSPVGWGQEPASSPGVRVRATSPTRSPERMRPKTAPAGRSPARPGGRPYEAPMAPSLEQEQDARYQSRMLLKELVKIGASVVWRRACETQPPGQPLDTEALRDFMQDSTLLDLGNVDLFSPGGGKENGWEEGAALSFGRWQDAALALIPGTDFEEGGTSSHGGKDDHGPPSRAVPVGGLQPVGPHEVCDVTLVFSRSGDTVGSEVANVLKPLLEAKGLSCWRARGDLELVERRVVGSKKGVVVILTRGALMDPGIVLALRAAEKHNYGRRVVVVHAVTACRMPTCNEIPHDVTAFSPGVVPFVDSYARECAASVVERLSAEGTDPWEDPPAHLEARGRAVRIFVSHSPHSGQPGVSKLYGELEKAGYSVWWDSTGQFAPSELARVVEKTCVVLVYLSGGYLTSGGCVAHLVAAIAVGVPIIVVREAGYEPPNGPLEAWKEFGRYAVAPGGEEYITRVANALRAARKTELVYYEGMEASLMGRLKARLGVPDRALAVLHEGAPLDVAVDLGSRYGKVLKEQRKAVGQFVDAEPSSGVGRNQPDKAGLAAQGLDRMALAGVPLMGDAETCGAVFEVIKHTPAVDSLDFRRCGLGPIEARGLARVVRGLESLTELDLANNELGPDGCRALAQAAVACGSLKSLDVSGCRIGVEGAKAVSRVIGASSWLSTVNVASNALGVEGARWITVGLEANHSLTWLDLASNGIRARGVQHLAAAVVGRITQPLSKDAAAASRLFPWHFRLQENDINDDGARSIARALLQLAYSKATLPELHIALKGNMLGPDGIHLLSDMARGNFGKVAEGRGMALSAPALERMREVGRILHITGSTGRDQRLKDLLQHDPATGRVTIGSADKTVALPDEGTAERTELRTKLKAYGLTELFVQRLRKFGLCDQARDFDEVAKTVCLVDRVNLGIEVGRMEHQSLTRPDMRDAAIELKETNSGILALQKGHQNLVDRIKQLADDAKQRAALAAARASKPGKDNPPEELEGVSMKDRYGTKFG